MTLLRCGRLMDRSSALKWILRRRPYSTGSTRLLTAVRYSDDCNPYKTHAKRAKVGVIC